MASSRIGRLYIEEARALTVLVRLALERRMWAATVHKSQQCVELFLKGALRLVAVEPARTSDVAVALRSDAMRFPEWLRPSIDTVASISTKLASDRGRAFYGDERRKLGPQELFDEDTARCAARDVAFVAELCCRLLSEVHADQ
jgi:HEPN domain-containing protein